MGNRTAVNNFGRKKQNLAGVGAMTVAEYPPEPLTYLSVPLSQKVELLLKSGCAVQKHDFNRNRRTRKWLAPSNDCRTFKWRYLTEEEDGTPRGSLFTPHGSSNSIQLSDVAQIIYGPYTQNFRNKSSKQRVDEKYKCFTLELRQGDRTLDFAFGDESTVLP